MIARFIAHLCRPYIWSESPGWGHLWRILRIGGIDNKNELWQGAGEKITNGKAHKFKMKLDLGDDLDRCVYFLGRYYDLDIQVALDAILSEGDTVVDIGANVGYFSLHAAHRVGERGKVIAFEPIAECAEKIDWLKQNNNITQLDIYNFALGDKKENKVLSVVGGTTILATISNNPEVTDSARKNIDVTVERGDDLLQGKLSGRVLIKIDVEGYEINVLNGLSETISQCRPMALVEMIEENQECEGKSCRDIVEFFTSRSYQGYRIKLARGWTRKLKLALEPVDPEWPYPKNEQRDVLWVPKEQSHFNPEAFV